MGQPRCKCHNKPCYIAHVNTPMRQKDGTIKRITVRWWCCPWSHTNQALVIKKYKGGR